MTGLSYSFVFTKVDGVMGLGLKYGDYNPFIYELMQNGSISKALFSIYMNRYLSKFHLFLLLQKQTLLLEIGKVIVEEIFI